MIIARRLRCGCLRFLIFFLGTVCPIYSSAQGPSIEKVAHLVVSTTEGMIKYRISEDLRLIPKGNDELDICANNNLSLSTGVTLRLAEIQSFGIGYFVAEDAGCLLTEYPESLPWEIVSLDGTVVAHGENGKPDLSLLEGQNIYIVTIGGMSFKYLPLR